MSTRRSEMERAADLEAEAAALRAKAETLDAIRAGGLPRLAEEARCAVLKVYRTEPDQRLLHTVNVLEEIRREALRKRAGG